MYVGEIVRYQRLSVYRCSVDIGNTMYGDSVVLTHSHIAIIIFFIHTYKLIRSIWFNH